MSRSLLQNHLKHCAAEAIRSDDPERSEAMYEELLELVFRSTNEGERAGRGGGEGRGERERICHPERCEGFLGEDGSDPSRPAPAAPGSLHQS